MDSGSRVIRLILASALAFVGVGLNGSAWAQEPWKQSEEAIQLIERLERQRVPWVDKREGKASVKTTLLPFLNFSVAKVRARSALALGRLARAESLPALVKALSTEKDPEAVRWLVFSLGQIPKYQAKDGASMEAGSLLADFIRNKGAFRKRARSLGIKAEARSVELRVAVKALAKVCGRTQSLLLVTLLNHGDVEVRGHAALAVAMLYRRGRKQPVPENHKHLLGTVLDRVKLESQVEVRWRLCYALVELAGRSPENERLLKALDRLLGSEVDERCQMFAARALGAVGKKRKPEARGLPRVFTRDIDWSWRAATEILRALAQYQKSEALFLLLQKFMLHKSFHVRRAAARLLSQSKPWPESLRPGVLKSLKALLADPWETVRAAALEAVFSELPEDQQAALLKSFSKEGPQARRACLKALSKLEDWQVHKDRVQSLAVDKDHRVRMEFVEQFGLWQGGEIYQRVLKALDDPWVSVAGTAVSILAKRPEQDVERRLAGLYQRSLKDTKRYELRELICDAFGERLAALPKTKKDKDETDKEFESRKSIQRKVMLLCLEEALSDPRNSVRQKAAAVLTKHKGEPVAFKAVSSPTPRPEQRVVVGPVTVIVETTRGRFEVELYPQLAPVHVRNLVHLIEHNGAKTSRRPKKPFYDGLSWHRVVSNFVVQGGCPNGDGWGDPGWTLPDELSDLEYRRGTLGMPKAGPDTGGCQLFFCHSPAPHLEGRYTIFGQVTKGLGVLDLLEEGDGILSVRLRSKKAKAGK